MSIFFTIGGLIYLGGLTKADVKKLKLTSAEIGTLKTWDYIAIVSFTVMLCVVYRLFKMVRDRDMQGIKRYMATLLILGALEVGLMYYKNSRVPIPFFFAGVSIFTILLLGFAIYIYFYYSLIEKATKMRVDNRYNFGEPI